MWRRYLLTWSVLASLLLAPGLACTTAEEPGGEALAEEETLGEDPGDPATVTVDTTNDGRTVAQRLQDLSIAANVRLRLAEATKINVKEINTEVQNGRVVLQGDVASAEMRQQAEQAAQQVEGVRQVVNRLNAPDAPAVADAEDTSSQPVAEARPPAPSPPANDQPPSRPQSQAPTQEQKPDPAEAEPPAPQTYTVRSGDNLWTIARKHGLSVDQLKRLNNLRSNNLRPGQKLRVK